MGNQELQQATNLQKRPESLPLNRVLTEQPDKTATLTYISGLLLRLADIYGIQNFEGNQAAMMANWIMDNYKYDTLNIVVETLRNPPGLDERVWRINPDTIREWMAKGLDKLAERRERHIQNLKADNDLHDPDYAAFKKRLDEERVKAQEQSKKDREGRIQTLSYVPMDEEQVITRQLHIAWIKDNYDPITGAKLETWISEEEWIKMNLGPY